MAEPLKDRRPQQGEVESRAHVAPFVHGSSDQLGTRQVSFEPGSETCIEILRFRSPFAESPAFESALRARVVALRHVEHRSLASAHFVERTGSGLILESRVPAGRRLADVLGPHNGWTFALAVLRDVLPALVVLNAAGGAVHGALSTERIVVTRDGRYVLTEHVLATAIESLRLCASDLRAYGIVAPDGSDAVEFTHGTDLMQLGYLTLSLLVGRALAAEDFPARVHEWLDEFVANAGSPVAAAQVRGWLERAMQVNGATPFASVQNAQLALEELSGHDSVQGAESAGALLAFASEADESDLDSMAVPAKVESKPPLLTNMNYVSMPASATDTAGRSGGAAQAPRKTRASTWVVAALSVLVLAEGAVIGGLLYWRTTARIEVVGPRPINLNVAAASPPASWDGGQSGLASTPTPTVASTPVSSPTPKATPVATSRVGGLTVKSAIELQVLKDGNAIGSTTSPLVVPDGRYTLEFVNQAVGYRVALPVTITGGQMTTVKVPVPNGRVSINAVPWAQVTIDGADVGQTPLANLSLPVGSHDVVFTHPQFGERRQTVIVKVDGIARVTQNFR